MKEEIPTDALLREFLLGKVDDEEAARIESLFLTDSEAREKVLVIEQELIEDYLEDSLATEDRQKFLLRYGQTAEQQQQLRITKAIKDWALRENASQTLPAEVSTWQRLRTRLRLRPMFVVPIAVTAMIAIIVTGIWLNSRMKGAALERELASLNTPASLREVPREMVSLDLSPVAVRSVEPKQELTISGATQLVEIRLPWIQKERYATYQAKVRRVGADESFTIRDLQAENDDRYRIRVRLPARMLSRGQYQVTLSGIDPSGGAGITEEYMFAVSG